MGKRGDKQNKLMLSMASQTSSKETINAKIRNATH